jgi:hypothetical protein
VWNGFIRLRVGMIGKALWKNNETLGSVECGEFMD